MLTTPTPSVFGDDATVHVGGSVLTLRATIGRTERVYSGDATMIVKSISGDEFDGLALMFVNGAAVVGTCSMRVKGTAVSEQCHFTIGAKAVDARDTYNESGGFWERRYSDGDQVRIRSPNNTLLVPVPFPIGRT